MTILDEIVANKRLEIAQKKDSWPQFELEGLPPLRDFRSALKGKGISLIAEIKRFSPSRKMPRENFDPRQIAYQYERNGAAAISVLTDRRFFGGRDEHIKQVREQVKVPLLRKEFIVEEYQVYESRALGADAILLIAALMGRKQICSLLALAKRLGLACLVEAHAEEDLKKIMTTSVQIVGINNRDLTTMEVDLTTSLRLRKLIPPDIIAVAESGIENRGDVLRLEEAGFDAALVGWSLMDSTDIASKLGELRGR